MDSSPQRLRTADLRRRLAELTAEVLKTEDELGAVESEEQLKLSATTAPVARVPRTPEEKVALFLELFGTRRSVYPKRWENEKTGKSGYSPACARQTGTRVPWKFQGKLREDQEAAVREMLAEDHGVLCAPPGAGKTVMGCAMIARARTSALVLVHRAVLMDQWRKTAMQFLGLKRKEIGIWRGRSPRLTRRLDIGMLPSLARTEDLATELSGYGMVIVDECHHVPATSFEAVLKACLSRRIYGLTATPKRKDRLEKLLFAQCGPIRHTLVDVQAGEVRTVKVRRTTVALPPDVGPRPPIHVVWEALVQDEGRIRVIVADLLSCVATGRSPLVLSDRKVYLDRLQQTFAAQAAGIACYRLDGQMGKKARGAVLRQIGEHYDDEKTFVLFATASLIGEGFDLPRLDTLVLSMPLSFKGRLIQYAGRLHRQHEAKGGAMIFDYVDGNHAITNAMFRRRLAGYRELGYSIEMPQGEAPAWFGNEKHTGGVENCDPRPTIQP